VGQKTFLETQKGGFLNWKIQSGIWRKVKIRSRVLYVSITMILQGLTDEAAKDIVDLATTRYRSNGAEYHVDICPGHV